jgi:hypothetical protein
MRQISCYIMHRTYQEIVIPSSPLRTIVDESLTPHNQVLTWMQDPSQLHPRRLVPSTW